MAGEVIVSVVVPVYEGMAALGRCLDALDRQSHAAYEVIVVDNGGNPGIDRLCEGRKPVRLCHHRSPGSYSARNAGIALAQGQILAFTDADCVPDQHWVRNGAAGMIRNSCRMAGGCIEPSFEHEGKPSTIELCDVILHTMNQEQMLRECTSLGCANMFVHRTLFESIGMFNGALYSGGDCEFTYRAHKQQESIAYLEDAIVFHRARRTLKELSQRYRRFAGAEFASKTAKSAQEPVRQIRSASFRYRIGLCLGNIFHGVWKHRHERNSLVLLPTLLLVESYITTMKTIEYARLGLGKEMQR
jgi:cellulose synthase/poly-beta-1,6-N-acetylglucosamine synthase-like glycosyltransferase